MGYRRSLHRNRRAATKIASRRRRERTAPRRTRPLRCRCARTRPGDQTGRRPTPGVIGGGSWRGPSATSSTDHALCWPPARVGADRRLAPPRSVRPTTCTGSRVRSTRAPSRQFARLSQIPSACSKVDLPVVPRESRDPPRAQPRGCPPQKAFTPTALPAARDAHLPLGPLGLGGFAPSLLRVVELPPREIDRKSRAARASATPIRSGLRRVAWTRRLPPGCPPTQVAAPQQELGPHLLAHGGKTSRGRAAVPKLRAYASVRALSPTGRSQLYAWRSAFPAIEASWRRARAAAANQRGAPISASSRLDRLR